MVMKEKLHGKIIGATQLEKEAPFKVFVTIQPDNALPTLYLEIKDIMSRETFDKLRNGLKYGANATVTIETT